MIGRGAEPVRVVNVEQVSTLDGMAALVTLDTPEGRRAFVVEPAEAAELGASLTKIAGAARTGLFIVGAT